MKFLTKLLIISFLLINFKPILASNSTDSLEHEKEKFNFADYLLEHVSDAYYWHIITIHTKKKDIDISVYLPVILYVKNHGWLIFCSKKLPHQEGKIFEIDGVKMKIGTDEDGMYKGKILVQQPDGTFKRPFDISFTKNVLALIISSIILIWIFVSIAKRYKKYPNQAPKGLQSLLEPIIEFVIKDIAESSIGKKYEKFTPFLLTVFFFIFFNNLMGLIPIFPFGFNLTGNITITFVLALFTFIITTINGNKHYWQHIFWSPIVPIWLKAPIPLIPLIEFLGIFIKPFVLMVRLFANIIGGHFVVLSFIGIIFVFGELFGIWAALGSSLLSITFALFINLLELLVAFIQAYVFTFLSALYFSMAIEEEH